MKKLLSLLAVIGLTTSVTSSTVACGGENNGSTDSISTIISVTDLEDINFFSLAGNDIQTQTEIINQVRNLNPNIGDAQINVSNINRSSVWTSGTATISAAGFSGSLTVNFTVPVEAPLEPVPISFPSSIGSTIQLQDGTILVTGGTTAANSFLASVDLSDPQVQVVSDTFPADPRLMMQLQDGRIFIAGGNATNDAFSVTVDPANPQTQTAAFVSFPSAPNSSTQIQDGMFLVVGGNAANGSDSFISVGGVDGAGNVAGGPLPSLQVDVFPSTPNSMTQLQDGTILVVGGNAADGSDSFLASFDFSILTDPLALTVVQGSDTFPTIPRSIIQLDDGTILVGGGNNENPFLASIDFSNPLDLSIQIVVQGSDTFPAGPRSIIELQDGTILVGGGTAANGSDAFLIRY